MIIFFYKYLKSLDKMFGENEIVEVDENVLVEIKCSKGRKVKKIWLYGMVERKYPIRIIYFAMT